MTGFDELWPGGPRFMQTRGSFKLSTDSVLLADFANTAHVRRCLDIGSGAGVLEVLLCAKAPELEMWGLEIQEEAVRLSRRNLAENGMEERVQIIEGDARRHRTLIGAEDFDLVVSNPPYFPENSGHSAPEVGRASAREERNLSLAELCACAAYALRWGGVFAVVHRPERLSELLCAMSAVGMEPKRLRLVAYSALRAPSLVLAEGKKGAKPGLKFEPPLVLTEDGGVDSAEVRRIYRRGEFTPQREETVG